MLNLTTQDITLKSADGKMSTYRPIGLLAKVTQILGDVNNSVEGVHVRTLYDPVVEGVLMDEHGKPLVSLVSLEVLRALPKGTENVYAVDEASRVVTSDGTVYYLRLLSR